METKKAVALLLLGLMAIVLIVNRGMLDRIDVDLLVTTVRASKSMIMLSCTALGVLVGILLK